VGVEDEFCMSRNLTPEFDRAEGQQVPHQVNLAPLPACPLKVLGDGLGQSAMTVGDHEHHAAKTAALESAKSLIPGQKTLSVADQYAEDLEFAIFRDARHNQGSSADNPVIISFIENLSSRDPVFKAKYGEQFARAKTDLRANQIRLLVTHRRLTYRQSSRKRSR
jgi:hypothetical protein